MMDCFLERKRTIAIGFLVLLAAAAFSAIGNDLNPWIDDDIVESSQFYGRRDLSVSPGRVDVGRRSSVRRKALRKQKLIFDPKTVVIKPVQDLTSLRGKSWKDATILDDGTYLLFEDEFGRGNYCATVINNKNRIKRMHYHAGSCKHFDSQFGNRLGTVYGMKMVANALHVPFHFTCEMDEGERANGAAFLMNLNSRSGILGPPPKNRDGEELTVEDVCRACANMFCTWRVHNLVLASDAMISDWNHLADPLVAKISDHDDAVIHLRLGDALFSAGGRNEKKGLFPHATYINLLKQAQRERGAIRSIGLVTAPFTGSFVRSKYDAQSTSRSKIIAMDLFDAIQRAFPRAKVRLHNRPEETIVESLARLVHARKVAICGCSTFCPYPLLATKGIGFVYNPLYGQNAWVKDAAELHENFRLFNTPLLNGLAIENHRTGESLDIGAVMQWLRNQKPDVGNIDITEPPILRSSKIS
eukprot:CCRYP_016773-RA/>CCRYP_016773-RA protein AED:0.08 eAED:0.08 QI:0/-1/0/1/-1/1/1/0/471